LWLLVTLIDTCIQVGIGYMAWHRLLDPGRFLDAFALWTEAAANPRY
jgi:hypothetical protein